MIKYPELLRIQSDRVIKRSDKQYANKGMVDDFLRVKNLVIEEKLDGSQLGISFKSGAPYVQTKNRHLDMHDKSPQFNGVWPWIWENIEKIEQLKGYLVFGEWVRIQHHMVYDKLPDWFMPFDVYNYKTQSFINFLKKIKFFEKVGFAHAPVICVSKPAMQDIEEFADQPSYFGSEREGCVIKNYDKQQFIKYVRREFIEGIEEEGHWTSNHKQKLNELKGDKK